MPYVNLKTNVKVEDKKELQKLIGDTITIIPKKTLERTMILIDDEQPLFFAGTEEACAMVETQVNKGTDQSTAREYGDAMIKMLVEKLQIPENRIYVNVNEIDNWIAH